MSQERENIVPASNDSLSEDQLDKVAGGVLFSMGDETTYTGYDMPTTTTSTTSTTSTTTTSTSTTSYTFPEKITTVKPTKSTWG